MHSLEEQHQNVTFLILWLLATLAERFGRDSQKACLGFCGIRETARASELEGEIALVEWKVGFGLCGRLQDDWALKDRRRGRPCWFWLQVVCGGGTVMAKWVAVTGIATSSPFRCSWDGEGLKVEVPGTGVLFQCRHGKSRVEFLCFYNIRISHYSPGVFLFSNSIYWAI